VVEIHKTLTVLVVEVDTTVAVQVVTKNHLIWVAVAVDQDMLLVPLQVQFLLLEVLELQTLVDLQTPQT
jgi:hypothetical protein